MLELKEHLSVQEINEDPLKSILKQGRLFNYNLRKVVIF